MISENIKLHTSCLISCLCMAIWFHDSEEELPKTSTDTIIES